MIRRRSSPSPLHFAAIHMNSQEEKRSFKSLFLKKKKKSKRFRVERNQSVMLIEPRSHSVMECNSLHCPSTLFPLSSQPACFHTFAPNYCDHPWRLLGGELAPFNQDAGERGRMNNIKVISSICVCVRKGGGGRGVGEGGPSTKNK